MIRALATLLLLLLILAGRVGAAVIWVRGDGVVPRAAHVVDIVMMSAAAMLAGSLIGEC